MANYAEKRTVQIEVLEAARRVADGDWTFRLVDVVRELAHLNESTVRTHITSRCCVNAPSHHQHRWPYFRRIGRGVYQVEPDYRRRPASAETPGATAIAVRETAPAYVIDAADAASTIHVVVTESEGWYVAECMEAAVVTQSRTLDELVGNLREAVGLHLEGEDPTESGLSPKPRLSMTYEFTPFGQ